MDEPTDSPTLSPELDLLEILSGQDELLGRALLLFSPAKGRSAIDRVRHVISIYIKSGFVQLIRVESGEEYLLKDYEVRLVLTEDESLTLDTRSERYYLLRLTEKGYRAFAEDSHGFFAQLFGQG